MAGIVQKLESEKVDLIVLDQGIDTTTMYGRLQFNILGVIGEFEQELIKERSMEGRLKAIARGVKFGAKPKLTKQEIRNLVRDFEAPGCSKTDIAGIMASAGLPSTGFTRKTAQKASRNSMATSECPRWHMHFQS